MNHVLGAERTNGAGGTRRLSSTEEGGQGNQGGSPDARRRTRGVRPEGGPAHVRGT